MPWLRTRAEVEERLQLIIRAWGNLENMAEIMKVASPSASHEELLQVARRSRLSHSPAAIAAYILPNLDLDVRDVLPAIRVPTLVMHRTVPPLPLEQNARYLAEHIPTARLVELPGADVAPSRGDQEVLFAELERFLGESAEERDREVGPDRVLATILFTDLVDSTPCVRARRSPLARTRGEAPSAHPNAVGVLPRNGRWIQRVMDSSRPSTARRGRFGAHVRFGTAFASSASRSGRGFTQGSASSWRQGRRYRRPHRGASRIRRATGRGSRLSNRQGSRRRLRYRAGRSRRSIRSRAWPESGSSTR